MAPSSSEAPGIACLQSRPRQGDKGQDASGGCLLWLSSPSSICQQSPILQYVCERVCTYLSVCKHVCAHTCVYACVCAGLCYCACIKCVLACVCSCASMCVWAYVVVRASSVYVLVCAHVQACVCACTCVCASVFTSVCMLQGEHARVEDFWGACPPHFSRQGQDSGRPASGVGLRAPSPGQQGAAGSGPPEKGPEKPGKRGASVVSGRPTALCRAQRFSATAGRRRPTAPPGAASHPRGAHGRWSWRARGGQAGRAGRCWAPAGAWTGPQKDRGTNRPLDTGVGRPRLEALVRTFLCVPKTCQPRGLQSAQDSLGRIGRRLLQTSESRGSRHGGQAAWPQEPPDLLRFNAGR